MMKLYLHIFEYRISRIKKRGEKRSNLHGRGEPNDRKTKRYVTRRRYLEGSLSQTLNSQVGVSFTNQLQDSSSRDWRWRNLVCGFDPCLPPNNNPSSTHLQTVLYLYTVVSWYCQVRTRRPIICILELELWAGVVVVVIAMNLPWNRRYPS